MLFKSSRTYRPNPVDTSDVKLSPEILALCEQLAQNTHDQWAAQRIAEGWTWGSVRSDRQKKHPLLVPYQDLPESEKEYDRITSQETIKVLLSLGYTIQKPGED